VQYIANAAATGWKLPRAIEVVLLGESNNVIERLKLATANSLISAYQHTN
jgi:hypothetical protein